MTSEKQRAYFFELSRIEGLFVGQLTLEELELFRKACEDGCAQRSYEGVSGFMGLAKVRVI